MLFKYLTRFPMPSEHLTRAINISNAQTRGGIGILWYISRVYDTPCAQNQNGTCHPQFMALLMALAANYVNRYAHQTGQSLRLPMGDPWVTHGLHMDGLHMGYT